jgi:hypothetical protein
LTRHGLNSSVTSADEKWRASTRFAEPRIEGILMKSFQRITIILLALIFLFIGAGFSQTVSTIHSFSGGDGEYPYLGGLTQGRNGALYGVTLSG